MKLLLSFFRPRNLALTLFSLAIFILTCVIFANLNLLDFSSLSSALNLTNATLNFIAALLFSIAFSAVALSPLGEAVYRKLLKLFPITCVNDIDHVTNAFERVYKKAKKSSPHLSSKIKLYVFEDESINALALGSRTLAISTACLNIDDAVLDSILSHEFAHLQNYDSFRSIMISSSSIILFLSITLLNIALLLFSLFTSLFSEKSTILGIIGILLIPVFLAIAVVKIANWLIKLISSFLQNLSSRQCEYAADRFAVEIGCGDGLIPLFEYFSESESKHAFHFFNSTHPYSEKRLIKVKALLDVKESA